MSQRADRNGIDPPVEKERRDLRREPIEVDSATGEGGGQVLRSVLRLSLLTGQPFRPSREIAGRQRSRVLRRLHKRLPDIEPEVMVEELPAASCGTGLLLPAECQSERACCFALGARGKRAELVADAAVDALAAFLISDGAGDPWLADQLLLPLALADGPSELRTSKVTRHLLTNAEVIRLFLSVEIDVDGPLGAAATVRMRPGPDDSIGPSRKTEEPCSAET